jgi:hypothetical protein
MRHVLADREKHGRAKRALKAAAERLRVAEQLGDAPTIVTAMKDRDEADEAVRRTWWPTDADKRELTESCVQTYLKADL